MIFCEICDPAPFMEAYMDIELEITKEAEDKSEGFFESIWNKIVAFVKRVWEFFVKLFKRIINGFANILTFGKYKPFDINDVKLGSPDVEKIKAIKNSMVAVPVDLFDACEVNGFIDPNKIAGYLDMMVSNLITYGYLTGKQTTVMVGLRKPEIQELGNELLSLPCQDLQAILKQKERYYNYYLTLLRQNYTEYNQVKVESIIDTVGLELKDDGYVILVRKINDFISAIAKAIIDLKPIINDKPDEYLDDRKTRMLQSVDFMCGDRSEEEKNIIRSSINAWGLAMSRFLKEELAIFSDTLAGLNRLCDGLLVLIRKDKKK